ncbi:metallophosphatase family protein [Planctomycetales bacterium]|nr:metallophosphatase family protein [Planctomycetales bacterium]
MSGDLYGIVSDIHGNAEAFAAALAAMKELGVTKICCLGDIVGYGASPVECVQVARDHCQFIIRGNHDSQVLPPRHPDMRAEALAALEYAGKVLSPADIEWLKNLPTLLTPDEMFIICHGALTDPDDYILTTEAALTNLNLLERRNDGKNLCFFGHTHLPMAITRHGAKTNLTAGGKIIIDPTKSYLINPGSVGQPRDKSPLASLVTYSPFDGSVTWHRLNYDTRAAQEKMKEADLPKWLWQRLSLGK